GGTFSMKESLRMLDQARAEGCDITACAYPYNFWATYLNSARFDPGWRERFHISYNDLQVGGSSERLTRDSFIKYRRQGKLAVAYAIPEEDVVCALQCPWIMMGSDGILEPGYNNHPRASGMCARLIGVYVRQRGVLSLMDAIAKLTILPARRLEQASPIMKRKGRLAVGADADITIFDYATIIDRATVEHPELPSVGVEYVLVNGKIVKDKQGIHKDVRPGRAIRSMVSSSPVK
ncbi:MAG: amidohydrolase family protein, partial [Firmicutes bacterium]|nr:amidohydrolase family protein [Bacillota bacterium]